GKTTPSEGMQMEAIVVLVEDVRKSTGGKRAARSRLKTSGTTDPLCEEAIRTMALITSKETHPKNTGARDHVRDGGLSISPIYRAGYRVSSRRNTATRWGDRVRILIGSCGSTGRM